MARSIEASADPAQQVGDYARLVRQVKLYAAWTILPWEDGAAEVWLTRRELRRRVGIRNLKIAAIAMAHDATLLTAQSRSPPGPWIEVCKLGRLVFRPRRQPCFGNATAVQSSAPVPAFPPGMMPRLVLATKSTNVAASGISSPARSSSMAWALLRPLR